MGLGVLPRVSGGRRAEATPHGCQVVFDARKGEGRGCLPADWTDVLGVPRPYHYGREFQGTAKGVSRQPAAGAIVVGYVGGGAFPKYGRCAADGSTVQAGELRRSQEIPATGLHLREADAECKSLRQSG